MNANAGVRSKSLEAFTFVRFALIHPYLKSLNNVGIVD